MVRGFCLGFSAATEGLHHLCIVVYLLLRPVMLDLSMHAQGHFGRTKVNIPVALLWLCIVCAQIKHMASITNSAAKA